MPVTVELRDSTVEAIKRGHEDAGTSSFAWKALDAVLQDIAAIPISKGPEIHSFGCDRCPACNCGNRGNRDHHAGCPCASLAGRYAPICTCGDPNDSDLYHRIDGRPCRSLFRVDV